MANILSIETSTTVCSVALHREGELKAIKEENGAGIHSAKIMDFISSVLEEGNLSVSDIKAVAVSAGPGSYTGLRIGVSTAKGLAMAGGIPLIGVGAMPVLAGAGAKKLEDDGLLVPMLDARRMEVYCQTFDSRGIATDELRSLVLNEDSFSNQLEKGKVYFLGDGAVKAKEIIKDENAVFLEIAISAREMGELAYQKYLKSDFEDLAYFVPDYLKEFKVIKSKKNLLLK